MSSFLDRFVGRTQTVSKLGPEQLFKGREEAIYTHTHKSFLRASTQQLRQSKPQPSEQLSQEEEEPQEEPFHLPQLEQRYLNSEFRRVHEHPQVRSRLRLDKETNWLV
jgi:hypothetical protein